MTHIHVYLTDGVHVLFQPDAVGHKPSGLTVRVKNGSEAGGFVVVQHQAQKAVAQILLAGPGETVATFTCFHPNEFILIDESERSVYMNANKVPDCLYVTSF